MRGVLEGTIAQAGARGVHPSGTRWFVADALRAFDAGPDLSGLTTVFQPIVDLTTGAVVAHEGLTRGPAGEWHQPAKLFERAREGGHLAELDEYCRVLALRTALAACPSCAPRW